MYDPQTITIEGIGTRDNPRYKVVSRGKHRSSFDIVHAVPISGQYLLKRNVGGHQTIDLAVVEREGFERDMRLCTVAIAIGRNEWLKRVGDMDPEQMPLVDRTGHFDMYRSRDFTIGEVFEREPLGEHLVQRHLSYPTI